LASILIVDSYHHFTNYEAMLKKMMEALEPGGRLVIADYSSAEHRIQPRADQLKLHEIDPNLARKEIGNAGFEIVKLDESFVKWNPSGLNWKPEVRTDLWVLSAIRPK